LCMYNEYGIAGCIQPVCARRLLVSVFDPGDRHAICIYIILFE
jgi:hypothetical protein